MFCVALLSACAGSQTDGPVAIKTDTHSNVICQGVGFRGLLVADPTWGLAFLAEKSGSPQTFQIVWPPGYSGRRDGGQIVIYDAQGRVAAREGDQVVSGNPPTSDEVVHPCAPIEIVPPSPDAAAVRPA